MEDGTVQPANGNPGDPRLLKLSGKDVPGMLPMSDARGCARWAWNGTAIVFIPLASRVVPQDNINQAWADLSQWKTRSVDASTQTTGVQVYYNQVLAQKQALLTSLTRPGNASDDPPVAPTKTTVTPQ
jgi:hypothetical protein